MCCPLFVGAYLHWIGIGDTRPTERPRRSNTRLTSLRQVVFLVESNINLPYSICSYFLVFVRSKFLEKWLWAHLPYRMAKNTQHAAYLYSSRFLHRLRLSLKRTLGEAVVCFPSARPSILTGQNIITAFSGRATFYTFLSE